MFASVTQAFSGFISGKAALIFPEERRLELVRIVVGHELINLQKTCATATKTKQSFALFFIGSNS